MQKVPYVFPIIGGRKVEHLHQNIEALSISLTPEQIKALDDIAPFHKGFPYTQFVSVPCSTVLVDISSHRFILPQGDGSEYNFTYKAAGHFDRWPTAQPIRPEPTN